MAMIDTAITIALCAMLGGLWVPVVALALTLRSGMAHDRRSHAELGADAERVALSEREAHTAVTVT